MTGTRRIHLVAGFDEGYAMPAGVMLRSVARTLAPDVECVAHIVGLGLSPESRSRLVACSGDNVEVRFASFDPAWLEGLPDASRAGSHLNASVFIPLLADRFLPDEVQRYVELDADMVVRSSLHEVAEVDLGSNVLGAVADFYIPAIGMPEGVELWRTLGIDNRAPYLNSGLLVVDRAAWRGAEVERRAFAYLREHREHVLFLEQEALNVVLTGRWLELHPRWNFMVYLEDPSVHLHWAYGFLPGQQLDEARADPTIVHYANANKPWKYGTDVAFSDLWWEVLRETPWAGYRPVAERGRRVPSMRELARRARAASAIMLKGSKGARR